jgi:hypothetical protein
MNIKLFRSTCCAERAVSSDEVAVGIYHNKEKNTLHLCVHDVYETLESIITLARKHGCELCDEVHAHVGCFTWYRVEGGTCPTSVFGVLRALIKM